MEKNLLAKSIEMMTSFIIGEPFFYLSENGNKLLYYIDQAASIFQMNKCDEGFGTTTKFICFEEKLKKSGNKTQAEKLLDYILPEMGKLYYLTYHSRDLST